MLLRATRVTAIAQAISKAIKYWTPLTLFKSGEQGAWYDPSDLSTLYADSAGTTPAAAPGTGSAVTVGLMLDKSKPTEGGTPVVVTGWTNTAWDIFSSTGDEFTAEKTLAGGNDYSISTNTIAVTLNRWYEITVEVSATTLSSYNVQLSSSTNSRSTFATFSGTGTKRGFVYANIAAGNFSVAVLTPNLGSITVTGASVRELTGNHAYQTDSAKRPALSAKYNLLTYSEAFDNAAWTKTNASITPDAAVAPDGTLTADYYYPTAGSNRVAQSVTFVSAVYEVSVAVKIDTLAVTGVNFTLAGTAGAQGTVNILTGATVGSPGAQFISGSSVALANGYYRVTALINNTFAGSSSVRIDFRDASNNNLAGNGADGIYIWGADLRVANESSALPPYQRVVDALTYDTARFPYYLQFDGSNDALVTNSIDFSAGATNPPTVGAELVVNGGFTGSAADWTLNAAATYNNNAVDIVSLPSVTVALSQTTPPTVAGRWYLVQYTITNHSSGSLRPSYGSANGAFSSGNGTFTTFILAATTNSLLIFSNGGASYTGTIDNISVKEIDQNYAPDQMSVFAGVRILSIAGYGGIVGLGTTVNDAGSMLFWQRSSGGGGQPEIYARGSTSSTTGSVLGTSSISTPSSSVYSLLFDLSQLTAATEIIPRQNAAPLAVTGTSNAGTGTFANAIMTIGQYNNLNPLNGRIYSLIVLGRAVIPAELVLSENYVESKTFGKDMQYVYTDEVLGPDGEQLLVTAGGEPVFMTETYQ